jgi:hypothetical protein
MPKGIGYKKKKKPQSRAVNTKLAGSSKDGAKSKPSKGKK